MFKTKPLLSLLLALLLALTACSSANSSERTSSDPTLAHAQAVSPRTEHGPDWYFPNKYQYDLLLLCASPPSYFLRYERIAEYGRFSELHIYSEIRLRDYSIYVYTLIDPMGFTVNISRAPKYLVGSPPTLPKDVRPCGDFRTLSESVSGTYPMFGAEYVYYAAGRLYYIQIPKGDWVYTIQVSDGPCEIADYPAFPITLVGKLLNPLTAASAVQHFLELVP